MNLTKKQRELVASFINKKLGQIFGNVSEVASIFDLIFDDVVSDIEDTADWSCLTIEGDEVVNSDVEIAISRILYQKIIGD